MKGSPRVLPQEFEDHLSIGIPQGVRINNLGSNFVSTLSSDCEQLIVDNNCVSTSSSEIHNLIL